MLVWCCFGPEGKFIHIETDYLIVGGGVCGLAFADVLVTETDATVTIVDRDHSPGGHWNHSYPFVRLHQPSTFYGVASRHLGANRVDPSGGNKGLVELASGAEICAYLRDVMDQTLLPSGRVRYLPNTEMRDDGTAVSLISGATQTLDVRRKTVQAYHMGGTVPATHKPAFDVADGAACIPVGELADLEQPAADYVIIGSGKTGIDACLWLLDRGVDPDSIAWIMPRDSWFLDRRFAQPTAAFYDYKLRSVLNENTAIAHASSVTDLFDRLEASGNLLRLDPQVRPTAYKCATVTLWELERLRKIKRVIRKGHVKTLERDRLVLTEGELALCEGAVCVDCSATAIPKSASQPMFQGDQIVVSTVRTCQPAFSAAFVAHIEVSRETEAEKNRLCQPVTFPDQELDWLRMALVSAQNQYAWMQEADLRDWLKSCRLDAFGGSETPETKSREAGEMSAKLREILFPAMVRLKQLIDQQDAA